MSGICTDLNSCLMKTFVRRLQSTHFACQRGKEISQMQHDNNLSLINH